MYLPAMFPRVLAGLFIGTALVLVAAAFATDEPEQAVQFSYRGVTGPDKWGSLSPHFTSCSNGKLQSPVNIVKKETVFNPKLQPLIRDYYPANATLINNGFNIGLLYDEGVGVLIVNGRNYTLKQMHWHSPSEHRINGQQYPVELHLVHMADDGSISVVSTLYKFGHSDPLISQIGKHLDELGRESCAGDEESQIPVGIMKIKQLKRKSRKYFRYIGSLTTPPCTENVIWNILGKVRSVSKEQVAALKAPLDWEYKNNSRPTQPLSGRQIEMYDVLYEQQRP